MANKARESGVYHAACECDRRSCRERNKITKKATTKALRQKGRREARED